MKMIYMSEDEEVREFAKKAAMFFAKHEGHRTYANGPVEAGCLLAMRWGLGDDCVVVVRLDEDFEPVNYQQLIRQYEVGVNETNM